MNAHRVKRAAARGLERVLEVLRGGDVRLLPWVVFWGGAVLGALTRNGLVEALGTWGYLVLWWGLTAASWAARWWVPAGLRWCRRVRDGS